MNPEEPIFHGVTWNKVGKTWSGWIKVGDEDRHLVSHEIEDHVAELVRKETARLRKLGQDVDKRFGQLLEVLFLCFLHELFGTRQRAKGLRHSKLSFFF
jgi:hypothetical protein